MDDLSFKLAIALQLEDIGVVTASRKGKGKAGDAITCNEAAFNDYRDHLERTMQLLRDECLAESFDRAVRTDAQELEEITKAELSAERDRELAVQLSADPSITAMNVNHKWRDLAVGSGIEVTDSSIEQWEQKCFEWDVIESQNTGGPSTKGTTTNTASAASASAPVAPPPLLTRKVIKCVSCMEFFPQSTTLDLACTHTYCHVCLMQLFQNACKDEQLFPPRCCRQEIPIDLVMPFISDVEAEEFLDKAEEYTCDDRTYCSEPSCFKFISADNITCDVGVCPHCYFATCTLCKKEEHYGDCPDDPSMKLTLEVAAAHGWQRCQRCHSIVELSHGCQHMTCRCKAEWCYRCGVEWKTCSCSDWDTERLNRRAEDLAIREVGGNANPRVLSSRIEEIRNDLQEQHECDHLRGWNYLREGARCELCSNYLPRYIYVCARCRLRACNECRRNRI